MGKGKLHIRATRFKLWLLGFGLIGCTISLAQGPDDLPVVDSVAEREDTLHHFDKITITDAHIPEHRIIADSIVTRLKSDKDFWYASQPPEKKKVQVSNQRIPFFLQPWFRSLLWILITCSFIAILLWYLSISDVRLFRKSSSRVQEVADGVVTDDIFSIDYKTEIGKAVAGQNFRLAIRLMYLHVLWLMVQQNILQYKIEKTNTDYLLQLYGTAYYKDFLRLTRNFEYAWYGKFDISDAAFHRIQNDYQTFKARLQS